MKFTIYQFLRSKVKSTYIVIDILKRVADYNFDDFMKKRSKRFDINCYMIEHYCDNIDYNYRLINYYVLNKPKVKKFYKLRDKILYQITKYDLDNFIEKIKNNDFKINKIFMTRLCCDIEEYINTRLYDTFKNARHKKYRTNTTFLDNIFNYIDKILF